MPADDHHLRTPALYYVPFEPGHDGHAADAEFAGALAHRRECGIGALVEARPRGLARGRAVSLRNGRASRLRRLDGGDAQCQAGLKGVRALHVVAEKEAGVIQASGRHGGEVLVEVEIGVDEGAGVLAAGDQDRRRGRPLEVLRIVWMQADRSFRPGRLGQGGQHAQACERFRRLYERHVCKSPLSVSVTDC